MAEQLSPLDAAFLEAEDEQGSTSMAIASIAVFEGKAPSQDDVVRALASKLPLIPRYRQRVMSPPFDLAAPVWVDDPDFDLTWHVRRAALPAPGGDAEMFDLMSHVMSRRLERAHPLWENWVVDGLENGRWALISKVHHCMVDGVSGTQLYHLLLSTSPDDTEIDITPDPWTPAPHPSAARMASQGLGALALNPLRNAWLLLGSLRHPRYVAARLRTGARGVIALAGGLLPAPLTSLIGPISERRSYHAAVVSLNDVKRVSHHFGVTVNDVALAAATAGFREVLLGRGDSCTPTSVRTLVPVSVRAPGEEGIFENRVSCLLAELPVHLEDPIERLMTVHRHIEHLKAINEAEAGEMLTELAQHEPFPFVSAFVRAAWRLPQRSIVTVTTNVPGPREPLFMLGRPLVALLPYVPIAARLRFGVAILSYCDELAFGVTADHGRADDGDTLVKTLTHAIDELVRAVADPARATSG